MTVIPFRGLRYSGKDLANVTTPPYDIISPGEQEEFYNRDRDNVIRLEYGYQFPADTDTANRYTRAAAELRRMLDEGALVRDENPCFYIYEEIFTHAGREMSLKGVIGAVELSEFSEKKVLPHEETLSKAKADRFELMKATGCNFSQIYSLYNDRSGELPKLINELSKGKPDLSFVAFDGLRQNVWIVSDPEITGRISRLFEGKQLFIADGHHRYETALNYRRYMEEKGAEGDLWKYCMMFLVDMNDPGLVVFPTHRIVRGIRDFDGEKLVEAVKADFDVTEIRRDEAVKLLDENKEHNAFVLCYGGKSLLLVLKNGGAMKAALPDKGPEYRSLDVSVLHTLILEKVLKIDKENMAKQINLTYTRDPEEGFAAVDGGQADCVFLLNGTKVSQIKDISLVNEKMPQKSTYFYPKLVTGIVINPLTDM